MKTWYTDASVWVNFLAIFETLLLKAFNQPESYIDSELWSIKCKRLIDGDSYFFPEVFIQFEATVASVIVASPC